MYNENFYVLIFGDTKKEVPEKGCLFLSGGNGKTRTYDLMHVKHAL